MRCLGAQQKAYAPGDIELAPSDAGESIFSLLFQNIIYLYFRVFPKYVKAPTDGCGGCVVTLRIKDYIFFIKLC